jgi:hypothetical protein
MADNPTPNYGLHRPDDPTSDMMSNFEVWLNQNWVKLEGVAAPDSGTTLPQAGSYNIGDRFYKSDTQSIYLLAAKDANWGWHWRPIQDAISPWLTIPTTCLVSPFDTTWTLNPTPTNPMAIAMDNRGRCYWRGIIGTVSGNIPRNASQSIFKPLPVGIRPRTRGAYMLGHENLAVSAVGTQLDSWQGARIFIFDDETSNHSIRCFGGTADFNRVHLTGVNYAVGSGKYTTP